MPTCAVVNCRNRVSATKDAGIKFHKFPVVPSLRSEWILRCQRDDIFNADRAVVCSKHFTDDDYWRDLRSELLNRPSKAKLKKNAVPNVNVPPLPWEKTNRLRTPSCCLWHISTCLEENGTEEVDFYQFPVRNGNVLEQWMEFTCCPAGADVSKLRLCSRHFKLEDFELFGERVTLKDDAVPSLLPPVRISLLETNNIWNNPIDSEPVLEAAEPSLNPGPVYLLVPASEQEPSPQAFEVSFSPPSAETTPADHCQPNLGMSKIEGSILNSQTLQIIPEENMVNASTLEQLLSCTAGGNAWDSVAASLNSATGHWQETPQPNLEPRLENSMEANLEPRPKNSMEPNLEPRLENSMEANLESRFGNSMEPNLEPRLENSMEPNLETRLENSMEPNLEPRLENSMEPNLEPRLENSMEPNLEPRLENSMEPILEPRLENSMEPQQHFDMLNEMFVDDCCSQADDSQAGEANFSHAELAQCQKQLFENVRKQLCRICGLKHEELLPIFGEDENESGALTLVKKIEMYLPLQIQKNKHLPSNICVQCRDLVESWHDLHVSCVAADSVLRQMLCDRDMVLIQNILGGRGSERESIAYEAGRGDYDDDDDEDDYNNPEATANYREVELNGFDDEDVDNPSEEGNDDPSEELFLSNAFQEQSTDLWQEENDESSGKENNFFYMIPSEGLQSVSKTSHRGVTHQSRSRKFKCKYCQETFQLKELHEEHLNQCSLEPTMCHQCGKTVPHRGNLKYHLQRHVLKSFVCEKCGKKLNSRYGLQVHLEAKHGPDKIPAGFCESCCKVFLSESSLLKHIQLHENDLVKTSLNFQIEPSRVVGNEEEYTCPVCKRLFPGKLSLIEHMNLPKKEPCTICREWFSNERMVLFHICRRWPCSECGKLFQSTATLEAHKRIHSGEKPYACPVCGVNFLSSSQLHRHELSHQPPAFACEVCGKKFKRKETHANHMLTHSTNKQECLFCGKKYSTGRTLHTHIKRCHEEA